MTSKPEKLIRDTWNKNEVVDEIRVWLEAFATCAIEGNKLAIRMIELWKTDKVKFREEFKELEKVKYIK